MKRKRERKREKDGRSSDILIDSSQIFNNESQVKNHKTEGEFAEDNPSMSNVQKTEVGKKVGKQNIEEKLPSVILHYSPLETWRLFVSICNIVVLPSNRRNFASSL